MSSLDVIEDENPLCTKASPPAPVPGTEAVAIEGVRWVRKLPPPRRVHPTGEAASLEKRDEDERSTKARTPPALIRTEFGKDARFDGKAAVLVAAAAGGSRKLRRVTEEPSAVTPRS